jgi:hypothetical protein
VSHGGVWAWDDAWTIICVVDDSDLPQTLRYEIEYLRKLRDLHTLSDDFKVPRQVRARRFCSLKVDMVSC